MNSIIVPDSLPEILKKYVKAAIRSQPEDIISWSAEYFRTTGEQSPSIGIPDNSSTHKQDRTLFRILAFQLGTTVGTKERIEEVWSDLSLDINLLEQIYIIGKFNAEYVDMVEFLGITFGHWTKSLKETVLSCCEAFCKCLATDGYFLHVDVACKLYGFLAKLDCSRPVDNHNSAQSHRTGVDNQNHKDNNDVGKPVMKTCKSFDVSSVLPLTSLSENKLKSNICTSLESIFIPPATANACDDDIGSVDGPRHRYSGYFLPGIGPYVEDDQVQKVLEYFKKCASKNGGYVFDFDIESDHCPRLT